LEIRETSPSVAERWRSFFQRPEGRRLAGSLLALLAIGLFLFGFYYVRTARLIDRRLASGAFAGTVNIYSAPRKLAVGDRLTAEEAMARLGQSGYSTSRVNPMGWYNRRADAWRFFRDGILTRAAIRRC
jgi:hypothetical protein